MSYGQRLCTNEFIKGEFEMKKINKKRFPFLIAGIGILTAGVYFGNIASNAAAVNQEEITTIATNVANQEEASAAEATAVYDEIIPSEGIETEEEDNLYVELNNQLVDAIDDYTEGKITEEEYLDICKKINKKIDSKREYEELKDSEIEFKEEN